MPTPDHPTAGLLRLPGAYAPVPGPLDRESFFAAQARNRRTSWRMTALCVLAVLILGIPLSTVLGPLFYGLAILGIDVANLFTPMPDAMRWGIDAINGAHVSSIPVPRLWLDDSTRDTIRGTVFLIAVISPPGALFLLLVWLGVRALFLRSGVGGILLSLGAREPKPGDLEERQLVNLVAEMAIAAGVQPPRVMLLDTRAVNAAVVGSSLQDGVVVVSRGLLDALDRDETQGIIGHLVGSVGNGDLWIALTMLSFFQTLGVVVAALSSPFDPKARVTLRRLIRFVLRRGGREGLGEAEALNQLLAGGLDGGDLEVDDFEKQGWRGKVKSVAALPFLMAFIAFWMNQKILGALVIGPPFNLAWRTRRHLADATAVQLTRNPDGLARALLRLARPDSSIPGAAWASHLFVTWPRQVGKGETWADKVGFFGSLHPTVEHRLRRLQAMGSTVAPPPGKAGPRRKGLTAAVVWTFGIPVGLIFVGLLVSAALGTVGISLAIDGLFFFGLFVSPLHFLLRSLAQ